MTYRHSKALLAEIEHSANPELLLRELSDAQLLSLMEIERTYPPYMPRFATEVYTERMRRREGMYHEDYPFVPEDADCSSDGYDFGEYDPM